MAAGLRANRKKQDNYIMISIRKKHTLGLDAARQAAERIAQKLNGELNARYRWEGDELKFDCPGAGGRIEVGAQEVCVEVKLAFLLRPMRAKIEWEINNYLDEYLS
jgi:putative polyhydroxyalkanoate system protein